VNIQRPDNEAPSTASPLRQYGIRSSRTVPFRAALTHRKKYRADDVTGWSRSSTAPRRRLRRYSSTGAASMSNISTISVAPDIRTGDRSVAPCLTVTLTHEARASYSTGPTTGSGDIRLPTSTREIRTKIVEREKILISEIPAKYFSQEISVQLFHLLLSDTSSP